jgi:phosphoserine phosphatase RsbU/P
VSESEQEPALLGEVQLSCMEIWGGTQAAHNAISTPGLDFYVHAEPFQGEDAGGDIHFVSVCGAGRMVRTVLADVSGHGEMASEAARSLRTLVRQSMNTFDQTRMARGLNKKFRAMESNGRYATAILASYFGPTGTLILCNAGHPRPLHFQASKGEWSLLRGEGDRLSLPKEKVRNLPLGIIEGTDYAQRYVQLGHGDLVVLYTDALTEARDGQGEQLGEEGLLEAANSLDVDIDASSLMRGLIDNVASFREGPADDDVTVLMLKRNNAKSKMSAGERMRVFSKMMGLSRV